MKKKYFNNLFMYLPLLILNVISLLNLINAKLINQSYEFAFFKQLLWIIIGYIIIIIFKKYKINNYLFKYSNFLYTFSIFLLILVLIFGNDINGAKCWLNIFGFSFQPSELVKITLTISLINIYKKSKLTTIKEEFFLIIKYIFITLLPSVLVFLEPDTGAIINYFIIFLIILFLSKLNKWWYIIFTIIIFSLTFLFFISYIFFQDTLITILGTTIFYRMDRIINFTTGTSYQLENALITIGAASFFGIGLNKILLYIPEAPTDFIFAFSIGNYGILSALIILICYLTIDVFLIIKAHKIKSFYYKIFIYSYLGIFTFHQIYNICMNIGLLPIMGIPLPFLSYGGTSTLINFLFISIILNFSNKKKTTFM